MPPRREAETDGVGEHVTGVGEEGQRSGAERDDDLQHEEQRDDDERDPEPALEPRGESERFVEMLFAPGTDFRTCTLE